MKSKLFLTSIFALGASALSTLTATAVVIGGIDPATAPTGATDGGATQFTVIGDLVTTTGAGGFDVSLAASTFSYQSNAKTGASAIPFLATQAAAGSHAIADYTVIWVGTPLAMGAATVDVSAPLGVGTFALPANSTVVGGIWSDTSEIPVSYTDNTGDSLILAQTNVSVGNALSTAGSDWSTNAGVRDRNYHYQIDLQPIPEPSVSILFGITGLGLILRRRRS